MKKLLSLAVIALSLLTASAFADSVTAPVAATTQHVAKKHHHHRKAAKKHHKHKKHRHKKD